MKKTLIISNIITFLLVVYFAIYANNQKKYATDAAETAQANSIITEKSRILLEQQLAECKGK